MSDADKNESQIKPSEVYWSFLNEVTELNTDGLSFQQAQFVLEIIPESERGPWLVWHEGLLDWTSLEDCSDLFSADGRDGKHLPPFPPIRISKQSLDMPADEKPMPANKIDLRMNRRFVKNFAVEITVDSKVFKTSTVNISMGGMLLREPLPDFVSKSFNVVLTKSDGSSIKLFCTQLRSAKTDSGGSKRLRIIGAEQEGLLHSWLINPNIT